jgi:hypothetical protein
MALEEHTNNLNEMVKLKAAFATDDADANAVFLAHAVGAGGPVAARHGLTDTFSYSYTKGGVTVTVTVTSETPTTPGARSTVRGSSIWYAPGGLAFGGSGRASSGGVPGGGATTGSAPGDSSSGIPGTTTVPGTELPSGQGRQPGTGTETPGAPGSGDNPSTTGTTATTGRTGQPGTAPNASSSLVTNGTPGTSGAPATGTGPGATSGSPGTSPPGTDQPLPTPVPVFTPAPAAGATPPPPPPPSQAAKLAARAEGVRIGKTYGQFREWKENFLNLLKTPQVGVPFPLWDRMSVEERVKATKKIQDLYNGLPQLSPQTDPELAAAQREGFKEGAERGYDEARFETRAVWAVAELAKAVALSHAATPSAIGIEGSAGIDRDCAARTAARAIREATGIEVASTELESTFGLPTTSIQGFDTATVYCRNWFTGIGIRLAPTPGGFAPVAQGGVPGSYVLFMRGGASGGHVIYGEVTPNGLRLVDDQLGRSWTSVMSAQNALGMELVTVSRIEEIVVP